MDKTQILHSLDKKSNGQIYLGVVGSVRSGKVLLSRNVLKH